MGRVLGFAAFCAVTVLALVWLLKPGIQTPPQTPTPGPSATTPAPSGPDVARPPVEEERRQSELTAVRQTEVRVRDIEKEIQTDMEEAKAAVRIVSRLRGNCFGRPTEEEALCIRNIRGSVEKGESKVASVRSKVAERVRAVESQLAAVGSFRESRRMKEQLMEELSRKQGQWNSAIAEMENDLKVASP